MSEANVNNCIPLILNLIEEELAFLLNSTNNVPTLETLPPPVITVPSIVIPSNSFTDLFQIKGTAKIKTIIIIHQNSKDIGTINTKDDGTWEYSLSSNTIKENVTYSFYATCKSVTDVNLESPPSNIITVRREPVSSPEIQPPPLFTTQTGVISDKTPTIAGTAIPNKQISIQVKNSKAVLVKTISLIPQKNGTWTYTFPDSDVLPDDVYDFIASYSETTNSNSSIRLTIETETITGPTITTQNQTLPEGSILKVQGRYISSGTVKLYNNTQNTVLATSTATSDGNWQADISLVDTKQYPVGIYIFYAQGDVQITTATPSNSLIVTIVSNTPSTPTIQKGEIVKDVITLTGTSDPDNVISIYKEDIIIRSVQSNLSGVWLYTSQSLQDGKHTFYVIATNKAQKSSLKSEVKAFIINAVKPNPPVINMSNGVSVNPPTIIGLAQSGNRIQVLSNNQVINSADSVISSNGDENNPSVWKYKMPILEPNTYKISAYAFNTAGVKSDISNVVELIIENSTPTPTPTPTPTSSLPNSSTTLSTCINNVVEELSTTLLSTYSTYSTNLNNSNTPNNNNQPQQTTVTKLLNFVRNASQQNALAKVESYLNILISNAAKELLTSNNNPERQLVTNYSSNKDLYPVLVPFFYAPSNQSNTRFSTGIPTFSLLDQYITLAQNNVYNKQEVAYVKDVNPDALYRELIQLKYVLLLSTLDIVLLKQVQNIIDNPSANKDLQSNFNQIVNQHKQKITELGIKHKELIKYVDTSPQIPKLPQADSSITWRNVLLVYQLTNKNNEFSLPTTIYYVNFESNKLLNCI